MDADVMLALAKLERRLNELEARLNAVEGGAA
jgi:hypothetical protein